MKIRHFELFKVLNQSDLPKHGINILHIPGRNESTGYQIDRIIKKAHPCSNQTTYMRHVC